tara:strand:- start:292 stop:411 length:120 start_codon:yes stop_codon:yes gene_type:complete
MMPEVGFWMRFEIKMTAEVNLSGFEKGEMDEKGESCDLS